MKPLGVNSLFRTNDSNSSLKVIQDHSTSWGKAVNSKHKIYNAYRGGVTGETGPVTAQYN